MFHSLLYPQGQNNGGHVVDVPLIFTRRINDSRSVSTTDSEWPAQLSVEFCSLRVSKSSTLLRVGVGAWWLGGPLDLFCYKFFFHLMVFTIPRFQLWLQTCLRTFVRKNWTKNSVILKMVSLQRSLWNTTRLKVLNPDCLLHSQMHCLKYFQWCVGVGGGRRCELLLLLSGFKSLPGSLSYYPKEFAHLTLLYCHLT